MSSSRRLGLSVVLLLAAVACSADGLDPPPYVAITTPPTTAPASVLPEFGSATTTSRPAPVAASRSTRRRPSSSTVTGGDIWTALARCESGGDPARVSSSGAYRGAFQFSLATWRSMGTGYADPIAAPYAVQLDAARRLQARSGWGQWPTCARKLGLL